jgi:hypothetical protein
MAITFEQLVAELRVTGAEKAKRDVDDVRRSVRSLGETLETLGTLGGVTLLFSQLGEIFRTFASVSGIGIAAQFAGIQRALVALTGSGERAARMLERLKLLGKTTAFDTADVAGVAARMLGAGVSEQRLVPELSALLDLASHGMGLSREDFPEFMRNLLQIRGRGTGRADMADINQLKDRVPQIGSFLAAGIGGGVGREDALKQAQSMTGRELYDTIIRGAQIMAKGAAQAKALQDPIAALGNLFETLTMSMEPTGRILLAIGMPLLRFGQYLANTFQRLNELTGGLLGLAAIIGTGVFIATRTATKALLDFAAAMLATAGAARVGATTAGVAATTSATSTMTGIGKTLPLIGWVVALEQFASNWVRGDMKDPRRVAGADAMDLQMFGLFGQAKAVYDYFFKKPEKEMGSGKDSQLQEQKKTNKLLENLNATVRGGGPRTGIAASQFVTEVQLAKFIAL